MWRVAFDIGGTFTDFVLAGADVPPRFLKVASSPDDPARAVVAGFGRLLAEAGVAAAELRTILHATTVATNAIIERKGCPTALLTTDGFRDVLIIGRQKRYETHDLYMTKPPPLVPRRRTFEVVERVDPHGGGGDSARPGLARCRDRRRHRERRGIGGGLVPARVREPRARIGRRRTASRTRAGIAGVPVVEDLAQVPRVRTHQHDGRERVRAAHRRALCRAARGRARPAWLRERHVHHAVGGRARLAGDRGRGAGANRRVGTRGRSADERARRHGGGRVARRHLRHGRDHREARRGRCGRARGHLHLRDRPDPLPAGQRVADQHPRGRAVGDRSRRRLDRARRAWRHSSGSGERRRRPRTHVLPPRRRPPDDHGRQPRARIPQSRLLQRGRAAPRSRGRGRRARA